MPMRLLVSLQFLPQVSWISSGKGINFELIEISKLLVGINWDLCNFEEPKQVKEVARYLIDKSAVSWNKIRKSCRHRPLTTFQVRYKLQYNYVSVSFRKSALKLSNKEMWKKKWKTCDKSKSETWIKPQKHSIRRWEILRRAWLGLDGCQHLEDLWMDAIFGLACLKWSWKLLKKEWKLKDSSHLILEKGRQNSFALSPCHAELQHSCLGDAFYLQSIEQLLPPHKLKHPGSPGIPGTAPARRSELQRRSLPGDWRQRNSTAPQCQILGNSKGVNLHLGPDNIYSLKNTGRALPHMSNKHWWRCRIWAKDANSGKHEIYPSPQKIAQAQENVRELRKVCNASWDKMTASTLLRSQDLWKQLWTE